MNDTLQDSEFRNDEWSARERENKPQPSPIEQLIGTETCSYCEILTDCLSLPSDGDTERAACRNCIVVAFAEYWGGQNDG